MQDTYKDLLTNEVQEYIRSESVKRDFLKGMVKNPFPRVPYALLLTQIKGLLKSETKLPHLYENREIIYPSGVSMEQCSSWETALYKSTLVSGGKGADITGGFGVDSMALSEVCGHLDYYETNEELTRIALHNFNAMGRKNISAHTADGVKTVCEKGEKYDFIYSDPARRDDTQSRVYRIEDCTPSMVQWQDELLSITPVLMTKLSPMADISQIIRTLHHVEQIHVVALRGEVKEIITIQKRDCESSVRVFSVDIYGGDTPAFVCGRRDDVQMDIYDGDTYRYIYDPTAAMRKACTADTHAASVGLAKVGANTSLYASDELKEGFRGRIFEIYGEVNKKNIRTLIPSGKANVLCRNYPERADVMKKRLRLSDGGDDFVLCFGTGEKKYRLLWGKRRKNT